MTSRRRFLQTAAATGVGLLTPSLVSEVVAQLPRSEANPDYVANNGRIRQSIMGWCFNKHFDAVTLARHCKALGIVGMEGIPAATYPEIRQLGLDISLVGSHGFANGPCNPKNKDEVVKKLTNGIDLAKSIGTKNVITFTGMRFDGMDDEKAAQRCIDRASRAKRRTGSSRLVAGETCTARG